MLDQLRYLQLELIKLKRHCSRGSGGLMGEMFWRKPHDSGSKIASPSLPWGQR